jgi:hypothetical protein
MNAEITYHFLDRFTNSIKLEYCFGICKLIMKQLEETSPDECASLYEMWEKNIRNRFELNINDLEKNESISDQEKKLLYTFMENLIKEINSK